MSASKYVIIGAGGFIGRHLGRAHAALGHAVIGLDAARDVDAGFPVAEFDVLGPVDAPIPAACDVVYYLAQSPHYRDFPEHAEHLFAVNALGALRAATTAARAGARRFVYASTGNVYAPTFEPMQEGDAVRRDDAYALSKLAGEEMVAVVPDIEVTRVRLFGVFGPGQRAGLVPAIAERVAANEPVTLAAHPHVADDDGGLRISLTCVDDVIQMLTGLVARPDVLPGVVNLAAPEAASVREIATAIGDTLGIAASFAPAPSRQTDFIADVTRLAELIKVSHTPLDRAIGRAFGAPLSVP